MGSSASKASEAARRAAPRTSSALKPRSEPTAPRPAASAQTLGAQSSAAPSQDTTHPHVEDSNGMEELRPGGPHQRRKEAKSQEHHLKSEPSAGTRMPKQDTWRPPGAPPVSPAAANDLYSGGSSGDEDEDWRSDPAASSMLNQLAGSIRQRGRSGEAECTGPVEIPQIRRKELPPDLRERVSVDDLRGVFIKAQQAALSGHEFDADAEATRLGMDPATLRDAIKFTSLPLIRKTPEGDRTADGSRPSAAT